MTPQRKAKVAQNIYSFHSWMCYCAWPGVWALGYLGWAQFAVTTANDYNSRNIFGDEFELLLFGRMFQTA